MKGKKDKQRSTHKTKDRVTRTKTGDELYVIYVIKKLKMKSTF